MHCFVQRYFKVLVQELDVKMDKGWLLELVALFGTENQALDVRSSAFQFARKGIALVFLNLKAIR